MNVIITIASVMECDICPSPCSAGWEATQNECDRHWYEIISNLEIIPWDDAMRIYLKNRNEKKGLLI